MKKSTMKKTKKEEAKAVVVQPVHLPVVTEVVKPQKSHCGTIGAVFDFYAGTLKRAPLSWQKHGFEWLYRILQQPRKQWPRLIRYPLFPYRIYKEKILKAFGK